MLDACKHVFAAPEATHTEDDHLHAVGERRVQTISLLDVVRRVLRRRVRNRRVAPWRAGLAGASEGDMHHNCKQ